MGHPNRSSALAATGMTSSPEALGLTIDGKFSSAGVPEMTVLFGGRGRGEVVLSRTVTSLTTEGATSVPDSTERLVGGRRACSGADPGEGPVEGWVEARESETVFVATSCSERASACLRCHLKEQ